MDSHELLSLLSNRLHRQEVRLALIGSVHVTTSGLLLIELDTRFDSDRIGDCSTGVPLATAATVVLSLSAKFFTILWMFSMSCRVNVCDSPTLSTKLLLSPVTLLNPIGIPLVLLDDPVATPELPATDDDDDDPELAPEPPAVNVRLVLCAFDLLPLAPEVGFNVLSCSWISIMWSPRRTDRFSGDLPLRKSFTWLSFRDSNACMTVFSARWAKSPVSTFGVNINFDPSMRPLSRSDPS